MDRFVKGPGAFPLYLLNGYGNVYSFDGDGNVAGPFFEGRGNHDRLWESEGILYAITSSSVSLFDLATQQPITTTAHSAGWLQGGLAEAIDGSIYFCSDNGTFKVTPAGVVTQVVTGSCYGVYCSERLPIAVVKTDGLHIMYTTGEVVVSIPGGNPSSLCVDSDGTFYVGTGGQENQFSLYALYSGATDFTLVHTYTTSGYAIVAGIRASEGKLAVHCSPVGLYIIAQTSGVYDFANPLIVPNSSLRHSIVNDRFFPLTNDTFAVVYNVGMLGNLAIDVVNANTGGVTAADPQGSIPMVASQGYSYCTTAIKRQTAKYYILNTPLAASAPSTDFVMTQGYLEANVYPGQRFVHTENVLDLNASGTDKGMMGPYTWATTGKSVSYQTVGVLCGIDAGGVTLTTIEGGEGRYTSSVHYAGGGGGVLGLQGKYMAPDPTNNYNRITLPTLTSFASSQTSTPIDANSVVVAGGIVVAELNLDPTTNSVTYGGQPLPNGSVLRNTANGQKFLKVTGDSKAFTAIEVTPKAEWNYSTGADAAWEVLQDA